MNAEDASNPESVRERSYWFDDHHGGFWARLLRSDAIRNLITIVAVVAAVASVFVANENQGRILKAQNESLDKQLKEQRNTLKNQIDFQAEKAANDAWISYRDIGNQFPKFDGGDVVFQNLSEYDKVRYYSLVERLLMSADIVTISFSKDAQWRDAFSMEFVKHKMYLLSPRFLDQNDPHMSDYCTYRKPVRMWVGNAFKDDLAAQRRISVAEGECLAYHRKDGFVE